MKQNYSTSKSKDNFESVYEVMSMYFLRCLPLLSKIVDVSQKSFFENLVRQKFNSATTMVETTLFLMKK